MIRGCNWPDTDLIPSLLVTKEKLVVRTPRKIKKISAKMENHGTSKANIYNSI